MKVIPLDAKRTTFTSISASTSSVSITGVLFASLKIMQSWLFNINESIGHTSTHCVS